MIPQEEPFASQAAMIFLSVTLSFISVLGNGSFMAIFARFKMFRNFPNILFINLALIDFLNALVNVPLFVMYFVLQTSWLTGKTWAIISSSLNLELSLLNLVSMSVLMLDRFLAVYLDLKYFTWKTPKKAKIAVFLMWLVRTILVVIFSVPLLDMDLGGTPLIVSRGKIFRERKLVLKLLMALFTITSTVLGSLTGYFIHQKKKKVVVLVSHLVALHTITETFNCSSNSGRTLLNLPPLQAEARLKMDIKATKTVAMAIITYYICYIPVIAFSFRNQGAQETLTGWFAFVAWFCTFISSATNPIIYVLRNRRCHSAFWQLVKDPCGTSAFQEKPVKTGKEEDKRESNPTPREKPGAASGRAEKSPETGVLRRSTTFTSEVRPQANKEMKQRSGTEDNDESSDSMNEHIAVDKQTWRDGLETKGRANDQDFKSTNLAAEGTKEYTKENERKDIRTFTKKKATNMVHPTDRDI